MGSEDTWWALQVHFCTISGSASLTSRMTLPSIPLKREEKHDYTWTCLGNRSICWSGHVYTIALGLSCTVSPKQSHLLHLDMSTNRGLSSIWTCLDNRSLFLSGHVYTIGAWDAPGRVYTTESYAAPRCDNKTNQGPELHLSVPGLELV